MPSPYVHATTALAVATPTSAEGVIVTSDDIPFVPQGGEGFLVTGILNVTAGAGTTAVVVRVRQNTVTGTIVGAAMTVTLAAAAVASIPFAVVDSAAATSAPNQYVVTIQQTGGTGAGTVNVATVVLAQPTSEF